MRELFFGRFGDLSGQADKSHAKSNCSLQEMADRIGSFSTLHREFFLRVTAEDPQAHIKIAEDKGEFRPDIEQAVAILQAILKGSYKGFVPYIQNVSVMESLDSLSESSWVNPGAIFLNSMLIKDPVRFAEHLFHEGLHQKLYHTYLISGFYGGFYSRDAISSTYSLCPSWHQDSNQFNIERRVAAAHVYIHLLNFYLQLYCFSKKSEYLNIGRECDQRFRELLPQAHEINAFKPFGRDFCEWLRTATLDSEGIRDEGSRIILQLDNSDTEAVTPHLTLISELFRD